MIDRPDEKSVPVQENTAAVSGPSTEETDEEFLPESLAPLEPVPKDLPDPNPLPAAIAPATPETKSAATSTRSHRHIHSSQQSPSVAKRGAKNILPDYLNNPPPTYPESSRLAREQGVVLVHAVVDSSGSVSRVSLAASSGHPALDRAALEAVARWKFQPAALAGCPMASEIAVPVRFELQ